MTDSSCVATNSSPTAIIHHAIAQLRGLTQVDMQTQWRYWLGDRPLHEAVCPDNWQTWPTVSLNDRQHIAWEKGQQVMWLSLHLVIPQQVQGYAVTDMTLRLALTWWAELTQVFVDGELVQEGDLFDCNARVLLRRQVQSGEAIAIAVRLVSPGHDDGALVRSRCVYEQPDHRMEPCPEPGFVADEWEVLHHYLSTFASEQVEGMATAIAQLDWSQLSDRDRFDAALAEVRQHLIPLASLVKQRQITLLGHAHLDLAWLWPVKETWDVAERTFTSVLQLQAEFPELIFCHSTPALYAWIEEHRPALFDAIRQQVQAGRWEIVAGLWVEPELNVVSGESIARQILYGQHYIQEKFGEVSAIAWLPDTFGFCSQLPQLLHQGGVRYFVTQKLRWNDTSEFSHEAFWWRSPGFASAHHPDQHQILSLHSAPIGEGFDPIKMTHYATHWETQTRYGNALWLLGVGDHGGGPTRDMLETARRWARSPFFPKIAFSTAQAYLDGLAQAASNLPIWDDELYLEFHRGCYTSHADQKWWNRRCEDTLFEAELWATLATQHASAPYPKQDIETAWKRVLFNQFHDILPGSSIAEVYDEVNPDWIAALETAHQVRSHALHTLAAGIALPKPPHPSATAIAVFNPLNWTRSEVVSCPVPAGGHWQVMDLEGRSLPSHLHADGQISFWAEQVPGVGYRCFWLRPVEKPAPKAPSPTPKFQLENEFWQVVVDERTGNLARVFDKVQQRDVLSGPGNELQAFRDSGQYWDAWNIDPNYEQHRMPPAVLVEMESAIATPLHTSLRVIRQIGQSIFTQTYVLEQRSPLLKIHTQVDWQETHVLVKAAFPLALEPTTTLTREVPYSVTQHRTHNPGPAEAAKWEVAALRWANLSDGIHSTSLLSNGKHGYDAQANQLRLTLLRSPIFPDPGCDRGHHEFTYALYPHNPSWQAAQVVRHGYALNQPMQAVIIHPQSAQPPANHLPPSHQFLALKAENVILSALKPSEANTHRPTHRPTWVLRCYECHGQAATVQIGGAIAPSFPLNLQPTNLLEQPWIDTDPSMAIAAVHLAPWQVQTVQLDFNLAS
ncbi:alpha-mannosidase [Leptolyngbya sp. AN02str]|uniref:alpha-mannosidase n=1 Tax=Leptolyngbya sp. AN02str TaxID=3423363 RepID=UPI003D3235F8